MKCQGTYEDEKGIDVFVMTLDLLFVRLVVHRSNPIPAISVLEGNLWKFPFDFLTTLLKPRFLLLLHYLPLTLPRWICNLGVIFSNGCRRYKIAVKEELTLCASLLIIDSED